MLKELETSAMDQENLCQVPTSPSEKSLLATRSRMLSGGGSGPAMSGSELGVLRPFTDNHRIPSISMQSVNRNLALANVNNRGFGMRSLKEDSVFDLAKEVAVVERDMLDDDTF